MEISWQWRHSRIGFSYRRCAVHVAAAAALNPPPLVIINVWRLTRDDSSGDGGWTASVSWWARSDLPFKCWALNLFRTSFRSISLWRTHAQDKTNFGCFGDVGGRLGSSIQFRKCDLLLVLKRGLWAAEELTIFSGILSRWRRRDMSDGDSVWTWAEL